MGTLDSEALVSTLDTENMLQSIQDLPDQIEAAWEHAKTFALPTHYFQVSHVVVLGLGASAVSGYVVQALADLISRRPVSVVSTPILPAYVGNQTLVIASSYSGNTPEVVAAFQEAGERGAKLVGISTGGTVAALCRKYRAPHVAIQYGAQARAALGYLIIHLVSILERLSIVEIPQVETVMQTLSLALRVASDRYRPQVPTSQNPAKQLAEALSGRLPLIVSSRMLRSVARRWQYSLAQNAHILAIADEVHASLITTFEGLSFPAPVIPILSVVALRSANDSPATASAHNLLQVLAKRRKIAAHEVVLMSSHNLLDELLELMLLGDYTSYYAALLGGVDPSATPHMVELEQLRAEGQRVI
ncbi:SIS domain-containing protein [Candidatus Berkelbacteria bacterium]|nr:SIS domain-containing protein [Candidatus Berkelbacteria bacterium]